MLETPDIADKAQETPSKPAFISKRAIVLCAFASITILFIFSVFQSSPEPTHNGRTVSEWIEYGFQPNVSRSHKEYKEAVDALKALGPRALPTIEKRIAFTYSAPRKSFIALQKRHPILGVTPATERAIQSGAIASIQVLGSDANPLVGKLTSLIEANENAFFSSMALGSIGTMDAWHALIRLLESGNSNNSNYALVGLSRLSKDVIGSPAISKRLAPLLVKALQDNAQTNPDLAAGLLSKLAQPPDEAIETLVAIPIFPESRPPWQLRSSVVRCVEAYGAKARAASPDLIEGIRRVDAALSGSPAEVAASNISTVSTSRLTQWRKQLLSALQSVDPEAAEPFRKYEPIDASDQLPGKGIEQFMKPTGRKERPDK
ncbi:MAG: hypothetical protein ACI9VS_000564 [Candidatus Binatia bacterium]|jgi:hypothetical protein